MKKVILILFCLALTLNFASAVAETAEKTAIGTISMNGAFELRGVLPEGYQLTVIMEEPGHYLASLSADDSKPAMAISIAYEELMSEVERLNDLDDDSLALIEATFKAEDGVEVTYMETALGTKLMVVKEIVDGVNYVDFYTIYKGYEIEFVLTQPQATAGQPITDEQIQTAVKFLSDLDFVTVEEEETYGFYTDKYPEAAAYYSTWVAENGDWRIEAYDEDGGLKLMTVHQLGDNKKDIWEYAAALNPAKDALTTVPLGLHYRQDTVSGSWDETYYEDGDAVFTLNDNGNLLWNDLKEDAGKGLEFMKIGSFFGGRWMKNDIEVIFFEWYDGQYDIRLYRRGENGEILDNAILKGDYDPAADTIQAEGCFDNGELFTVTFSYDESRNVVWTENGESTILKYSYYTD